MAAQRIVLKVIDSVKGFACIGWPYAPCCATGVCPFGKAWADKAYAADLAHQPAECSNAGICNRDTGNCQCFPGFTGNACQRSKIYSAVLAIVNVIS